MKSKYNGKKWIINISTSRRIFLIHLLLLRLLNIRDLREKILCFLKKNKEEMDLILLDSQSFHSSLRSNSKKNWMKIKMDMNNGHKTLNYSMVPITFPLPYDNNEWNIYRKLMEKIVLFKEGFIREQSIDNSGENLLMIEEFPKISKRIIYINQDNLLNNCIIKKKNIRDAHQDFIDFQMGRNDTNILWHPNIPHLLKKIGDNNLYITN